MPCYGSTFVCEGRNFTFISVFIVFLAFKFLLCMLKFWILHLNGFFLFKTLFSFLSIFDLLVLLFKFVPQYVLTLCFCYLLLQNGFSHPHFVRPLGFAFASPELAWTVANCRLTKTKRNWCDKLNVIKNISCGPFTLASATMVQKTARQIFQVPCPGPKLQVDPSVFAW